MGGFDGCIAIYEPAAGRGFLSEARRRQETVDDATHKQIARILTLRNKIIQIDSRGRVSLDPAFLTYANLHRGDTVIMAGAGSRIEVWNSERWQEQEEIGAELLKVFGQTGTI